MQDFHITKIESDCLATAFTLCHPTICYHSILVFASTTGCLSL